MSIRSVALLIGVMLFALPSAALAGAISKPPNNLGLVGYWSFDEGAGTIATDFSGRGNTGTLTSGPTWVNGKRGKAISLDGVNDHVNAGNGSSLNFGANQDFSVSFWVNTASSTFPQGMVPISKGDVNSNDAGWGIYSYSDNGAGLWMKVGDGASAAYEESIPAVNDGNWHHVVFSMDRDGNCVGYRDAVAEVTTDCSAWSSVNLSNSQSAIIGANDSTNLGQYFQGNFDEVRIYSRALSAAEVRRLYTSGAARFTTSSVNLQQGSSLASGLVGHWTFDGPDVTTTVTDRSGQGNNGYFKGGATSSAKTIGKLGQGLQFDGVNDSISVGDINATDGASAITISMWVYQDSLVEDITAIGKWHSSGQTWYLATSRSAHGGSDDVHFQIGGFNEEAYTTSNIHQAGRWEHWVGVFDGTQTGNSNRLKVYFNGVAQSLTYDTTIPATTPSTAFPIRIGATSDEFAPWNGKLDDVRIYSRALTAAEVKQLYNLGQARIVQ